MHTKVLRVKPCQGKLNTETDAEIQAKKKEMTEVKQIL